MNDSDDKITAFPIFNLYNIPEALRKVANDLEANPSLCKHIVLSGKREDDTCWYKCFGADFNKADAFGILEVSKILIWSD